MMIKLIRAIIYIISLFIIFYYSIVIPIGITWFGKNLYSLDIVFWIIPILTLIINLFFLDKQLSINYKYISIICALLSLLCLIFLIYKYNLDYTIFVLLGVIIYYLYYNVYLKKY